MNDRARPHLAFALDYADLDAARAAALSVRESVGVLKVGLELFVARGPSALRVVTEAGCDAFLDLKLHDIPETVDRAVGSAAALGVRYLTIHAGGGPKMLEQAARRAEREGGRLTLLAVTVLTSLDSEDLRSVGVEAEPSEHALRLARLAESSGVRGLVCSVREVAALRAALGPGFVLVTPGIRPSDGHASDDQKRTGTPARAITDGADLLVVGRPIRDAADPAAAAREIARDVAAALP